MAKLFNRAKMTTATTGSGTVTLDSAANGFQSFADAGVSDSDVVQYVIEEGANFEIGTGTYSTSGTSLTRTPTESSESDDSAITLAGTATVSITAIADDYNRLQHDGSTKAEAVSGGLSVTGNITVTGTVDGRDVASDGSTIDGLGTASTKDVGTAAGNVVELDGSARLPAVDGSQLTNIEGVPSGVIAMWSGTVANVPTGWNICDGTNSTPDLRERFIVGSATDSGATYDIGDTGGAASVTLTTSQIPSHNHSGNTSNTGNHSHTFGIGNNYGSGGVWASNYTGSRSTSNTGAHSHSLSINNTGGGQSHENRPPYYALAFIMKS